MDEVQRVRRRDDEHVVPARAKPVRDLPDEVVDVMPVLPGVGRYLGDAVAGGHQRRRLVLRALGIGRWALGRRWALAPKPKALRPSRPSRPSSPPSASRPAARTWR